MSRAARLLELLQLLRRQRAPVPGATLAASLGISLRTLYRDVATLQGQGADISGEAGLGYRLQPGFTLPPLMLDRDELEAVSLGMAWVADRGDGRMQEAARDVLAKLAAVLPQELRRELDGATMLVGPGTWATADDHVYTLLRTAMRGERKLTLAYRDQHGATTRRTVWPCAIGVFDATRMLVAWCELRGGFRHFRLDRIAKLELTAGGYPRRRQDLLRAWRADQGIPADGN
ncbi:MAG: YafY family transcriptional regulator [Planctomycetes bacterium]|nr:YafY family transcriptional regulator [Planctomycetota bacterium]